MPSGSLNRPCPSPGRGGPKRWQKLDPKHKRVMERPCYGKGFKWPREHCKPLGAKVGHDCDDCPFIGLQGFTSINQIKKDSEHPQERKGPSILSYAEEGT